MERSRTFFQGDGSVSVGVGCLASVVIVAESMPLLYVGRVIDDNHLGEVNGKQGQVWIRSH